MFRINRGRWKAVFAAAWRETRWMLNPVVHLAWKDERKNALPGPLDASRCTTPSETCRHTLVPRLKLKCRAPTQHIGCTGHSVFPVNGLVILYYCLHRHARDAPTVQGDMQAVGRFQSISEGSVSANWHPTLQQSCPGAGEIRWTLAGNHTPTAARGQ